MNTTLQFTLKNTVFSSPGVPLVASWKLVILGEIQTRSMSFRIPDNRSNNSRVCTGLFSSCFTETMGTFTETMGTFPILSPVRTARDVFLSVTFTESSGYFSRRTAAQEKLPSRFSRDD